METLKPSGFAVHTTEFNLSPSDQKIEDERLSIYHMRDIEELSARLEQAGCLVAPVDRPADQGFAEIAVGSPSYKENPDLRPKINDYHCTSVDIIVRNYMIGIRRSMIRSNFICNMTGNVSLILPTLDRFGFVLVIVSNHVALLRHLPWRGEGGGGSVTGLLRI